GPVRHQAACRVRLVVCQSSMDGCGRTDFPSVRLTRTDGKSVLPHSATRPSKVDGSTSQVPVSFFPPDLSFLPVVFQAPEWLPFHEPTPPLSPTRRPRGGRGFGPALPTRNFSGRTRGPRTRTAGR